VLAVVKAALPNRIKCPHCKSRLVYKPFPWVLTLISLVLYLALILFAVMGYRSVFTINENFAIILNIFIAIVLWQPFEFALATRLRNKHELCTK